jgi:SET domain-containing protein
MNASIVRKRKSVRVKSADIRKLGFELAITKALSVDAQKWRKKWKTTKAASRQGPLLTQ